MFIVNHTDINCILRDFGIFSETVCFSELQRCDYEHGDYASREEIRLVIKAELKSGFTLVIRFKNEKDVTIDIVESQSRFADELRKNGISTPKQYQADGAFAKWYQIGGYDVIVTVEQFAENEVMAVNTAIAGKTGALLAKMHNISEQNNLHVQNAVLFDPFAENELFDFESFQSVGAALDDADKVIFDNIVRKYQAYMDILEPLKKQPRYAVQGDISNCNLYLESQGSRSGSCDVYLESQNPRSGSCDMQQSPLGEVGVFDFNRCGDNNLFCDAVMQAVFEARLMDYPNDSEDDIGADILTSFLKGYCSVRSFSEEQQNWYAYLYAIIDAFWSADIKWNQDCLVNAVKHGDREGTRKWLEIIWQRLISLKQ